MSTLNALSGLSDSLDILDPRVLLWLGLASPKIEHRRAGIGLPEPEGTLAFRTARRCIGPRTEARWGPFRAPRGRPDGKIKFQILHQPPPSSHLGGGPDYSQIFIIVFSCFFLFSNFWPIFGQTWSQNPALGLGTETFEIRPRRAGFQPPGPGETTSAPGWRAGWGTSFGTLRVSR